MNGEPALRPTHPLTAGLLALAVLLQGLLAVPLSVRMMGPVTLCLVSETGPEAARLPPEASLPGATGAVTRHSGRTSQPGDQHPSHLCPICFAASLSTVLPSPAAAVPVPRTAVRSVPPVWRLTAWPPAHPVPYQSRAPPALA